MKIRWRVALVLAFSLIVAASLATFVTAITYEQSVFNSPGDVSAQILEELGVSREVAIEYLRENPEAALDFDSDKPLTADGRSVNDIFADLQRRQNEESVRRSRVVSAVAIGALALLTGLAGWLIAGRILRPVRLITRRARAASELDLTSRVALTGPDDEMKQLGDTFDEMLTRIERSFVAQRRFSAQVSHELRTPLSVIRSESDLLLSSAATPHDARRTAEAISAATQRAERLVAALLVLSRTESGHLDREALPLDELVGDVVGQLVTGRSVRSLRVDLELQPVTVVGDRALLESLVTNLVDNAAQHNGGDGWLRVAVAGGHRHATLEVVNSVAEGIDGESFATGRSPSAGNRVGFTVVEAIVDAHNGRVDVAASEPGAVTVRVQLPAFDLDTAEVEPRPVSA
jgi:signal transduction histidine kinase